MTAADGNVAQADMYSSRCRSACCRIAGSTLSQHFPKRNKVPWIGGHLGRSEGLFAFDTRFTRPS